MSLNGYWESLVSSHGLCGWGGSVEDRDGSRGKGGNSDNRNMMKKLKMGLKARVEEW